ncbi:transmembrane-type terpene cyclase [Paenibacillus roseipurpureus]|uniref:Integral membrane protein n=1 Tax=Paenibacillus roseopurpureus TaxID=2918901 RepID=A0AA96LPE9_9BACL|nr:hypothetical protein [Paenibacillus sp. MBLB1832]WNR44877.1 hypothetical protein MJB10_01620 [Paenibacillus sp. MBLB1832]
MAMQHLLSEQMELFLQVGLAVFWTITYILIIIQGFQDKASGLPLPAICANITWEFLFAFVMPFHKGQMIISLIWFLLDCVILFQAVYYAGRQYPPRLLLPAIFSLLVISLLLHVGMVVEFHDPMGKYTAFGINLMMSVLFVGLPFKQGLKGQSIYIAYYKMLGTLCASVLCYSLFPESLLLLLLCVLTTAADLVYIGVVHRLVARGDGVGVR